METGCGLDLWIWENNKMALRKKRKTEKRERRAFFVDSWIRKRSYHFYHFEEINSHNKRAEEKMSLLLNAIENFNI